VTGQDLPIWISDFVLPGYGTGAIMAVPAHDEREGHQFALRYGLSIKRLLRRCRMGFFQSSLFRAGWQDDRFGSDQWIDALGSHPASIDWLSSEGLGEALRFLSSS